MLACPGVSVVVITPMIHRTCGCIYTPFLDGVTLFKGVLVFFGVRFCLQWNPGRRSTLLTRPLQQSFRFVATRPAHTARRLQSDSAALEAPLVHVSYSAGTLEVCALVEVDKKEQADPHPFILSAAKGGGPLRSALAAAGVKEGKEAADTTYWSVLNWASSGVRVDGPLDQGSGLLAWRFF